MDDGFDLRWERWEVATFYCVDCYTMVTTSEAEGVSTVECPMCSSPAHRGKTEQRSRLATDERDNSSRAQR